MPIIESIVGFAVGVLGNYVATITQPPIGNPWQRRLEEQLAGQEALHKALASRRSFREEVRSACRELSRDRALLGNLGEQERQIWLLLSDARFQDDLADWLMAGGIQEGAAVRGRLEARMENALLRASATPEQIAAFKAQYFEALDRAIFSIPLLAAWRHQLSLDYLREQVAAVRLAAEKAAGIYSPESQQAALERYSGAALRAWDIVDLSNLPEGDIQIATQKLLLRQLYMPLRMTFEAAGERAGGGEALAALEQRTARRLREAGRFAAGENVSAGEHERAPAGARLDAARRLVVLGDPGGGKTTLLRWMATAYLLNERDEGAYRQLPDVETLPDQHWLPVLIRCRDLGEADLCRSFADFLAQHLLKSELLPEEAEVMTAVILERIAAGQVLLLVDGLDEITNPQVRIQFCQELERTAARYPDAPIAVTSRIVGYRDMPYRMGGGFEHSVIADLSREDRDLFAQRWVAVTEEHQTEAERKRRTQELIEALHSNDRIERLTGNPMLLTTLALVKRKVGKLPSRRNKLYNEAVAVLLNWNPRHYQVIDEAEAIPQLAYLAYEMCRRGVQRLTEDETLDLLDRIRQEYPNVRAIRQRGAQEFLALLEARSSILIRFGGQWLRQQRREQAVWEFRHLTFQDYLAARALLDGRYPGRDRAKRLAEVVAPLAGFLKESTPIKVRMPKDEPELDVTEDEPELEVTDSWQEALRLLVADCNDDNVDEVLLAVAAPLESEDAVRTARPRAVLAARCLADEPNASEEVVEKILAKFAVHVSDRDGNGRVRTSVDKTALELRRSIWGELLKRCLMREFFQRRTRDFLNCGELWATVEVACAPGDPQQFAAWFSGLVERLHATEKEEAAAAALAIMMVAHQRKAMDAPGLISGLLDLLRRDEPLRFAATWALSWLCKGSRTPTREAAYVWQPKSDEVEVLIAALHPTQDLRSQTVNYLSIILGNIRDSSATDSLSKQLDHPEDGVRQTVAAVLGRLGDLRAVKPLLARLADPEDKVRQAVVMALGRLGDPRAVKPLLARLADPEDKVRQAVVMALGRLDDPRAVEPLLKLLDDPKDWVRAAVAVALGRLGDLRAVEPLLKLLDDPKDWVRAAVAVTLGRLGDPRGGVVLNILLQSANVQELRMAMWVLAEGYDGITRRLLSRDLDALSPWLALQESITETRVAAAAERLGIPTEEVRARYEGLAAELPLKLEWREEGGNG